MATERNVLVELAKELSDFQKYLHDEFKVGDRGLEKAQRIIEELAKVKAEAAYSPYGYKLACRDAFENCRAIAEE